MRKPKLPVDLTDGFANDVSRQAIWQASLKNNGLAATPLREVVVMLRNHLEPVIASAVAVVMAADG